WVEYRFELTRPAYIDLRGILHAGYFVKDLIIGEPFARVTLHGPNDEVALLADRPASEDYEEHTEFFTSLTQMFPAGEYRLSVIANGNLQASGDEGTWGSGDADWRVFFDAAETPSPGCPSVEPYLISAAPD